MSTTDTTKKKKRAQWPRVRKIEGRNKPWMVDARINGTGERFFYETATEADTKAEQKRIEQKNGGTEAASMSSRLRSDATEAERLLGEVGATLTDAVRFYLIHLRRQKSSVPVKQAVAEFMVKMKGKSDRYVSDLRARLATFEAIFGEQQIGAIEPDAITEWLDALSVSPVTRNTMRRRLASLFSFAKEKKWRPDNPFTGGKKAEIKRVDEPRKKVRKLTIDQVSDLLSVASEETLPFWALAMFAGLRPESEIFRLRWEQVDFEERVIVVDGADSDVEETKTGRRVVKMKDNLAGYLAPYAKSSGPIVKGSGMWKKLRADKRRVGFGTPGSETPEEKKAGIKLEKWTEDITRHTFGSNLLAECGDIGVVSTQMGNSPDMVRKHYLALVKPGDAAKFWNLAPTAANNVVRMRA